AGAGPVRTGGGEFRVVRAVRLVIEERNCLAVTVGFANLGGEPVRVEGFLAYPRDLDRRPGCSLRAASGGVYRLVGRFVAEGGKLAPATRVLREWAWGR